VFNATFNNISAISWRSGLLAEQTGIPGEEKTADLWQVTDKHYQVMSYWLHFAMSGIRTHNISGDTDCTSSFKSNYHTITTTMTPLRLSC